MRFITDSTLYFSNKSQSKNMIQIKKGKTLEMKIIETKIAMRNTKIKEVMKARIRTMRAI